MSEYEGKYRGCEKLLRRIRELEAALKSEEDDAKTACDEAMKQAHIIRELEDENERLREGKELLAKQLAYYRKDNEKLNNALAWEHNESDNAKDAQRWRKHWPRIWEAYDSMLNESDNADLHAAIDAAKEQDDE